MKHTPVKKKQRVQIPPVLAARALFLSDRTCCVCRAPGKAVQIHHVNDDPTDNSPENLAVLCLDCHSETQVSGGFHRKLDGDQVVLYRSDWHAIVARGRAATLAVGVAASDLSSDAEVELATSIAEIYRDAKAYELLALHYMSVGNDELRDKYIDLAINAGVDDATLIYFRSMQKRLELIPQEALDRETRHLQKNKSFFDLGCLSRD